MKQLSTATLLLAAMLTGSGAIAQNTYKLFGPVNTRTSTYTVPTAFGTSTIQLNCSVMPVTATISSSPTASDNAYANVFADNYVGLTVNSNARVNICRNGLTDAPEGGTDCFNTAYVSVFSGLLGQNPDNFVATYGVPALDISSNLAAGALQAKFELLDFGASLGSSSVWLITNCTQTGIAPGGSITGNPISSTSPTPSQLTQNFFFDGSNGQRVEFIADYSAAEAAGSLTIIDNTIPTVNNQGLAPSAWPAVVAGTSFATTACVPDSGELDASGNPLCKLSTILCTNSLNSTPAGDNCPQSTTKNIQMFHTFDAQASAVTGFPSGTGLGFLMGSDNWPSSSCTFVGPEAGVMCPQNPLTSFLGDERSGSGGSTTNSTFIVVSGVPLPSTLAGFSPNNSGWSNSSTVTLNFLTTPPTAAAPNNNFIAARIRSLTYGIDSPAPYPDTSLPIPGDVTLPHSNPVTCPGVPTAGALPLAESDTVTLAEGAHQLHYFATDCAGTDEFVFTPNISNPGNWVSFKTLAINVDTTQPFVATGPTLSPAGPYVLNQTGAKASYSCSDPAASSGATPSGVVVCGPTSASSFPPTPNTGTLSSAVNTSAVGPQTFTVNVRDLAGNVGTPVPVAYNVDYSFTGFLAPVKNPPAVNNDEAGDTVPLKFTLGGNEGLAILAAGYPISVPIACSGKNSSSPASATSESRTGLTYNSATRLYTYSWRTNRAWKNTCRQFILQLTDGTTHSANFAFRDK
jgi:hypothetical protein